ncbi:MAG: STAS domain-containing protein [Paludibacteraceae bacterium]|nr:STAS domain-containing protein [Paludibacteraceae bacterium]
MTLKIKESNGQLLAFLNGRLDTATSTQFANDMQPLLDNTQREIVLDCTDLEFISSSGLRLLLTLRKASLAAGGKIIIRHVNESVKQVFSITGFLSLFTFE